MELSGEHRIPASRQVVWDALHDTEILKECITGCQSLEMTAPDRMAAKVLAKVGPVKATFDADVAIENSVAPQSYTLVGEGKGGVAGFAKGSATVNLEEDGSDTILKYHAEAKIGGKLAQLGSRLVDSTAKRYAADFFSTLSEKLGQPAVGTTPMAEPAPAEPMAVARGRVEPTVPPAPHGAAPGGSVPAETDAKGDVATEGRSTKTAVIWGVIAFAVVILILLALA